MSLDPRSFGRRPQVPALLIAVVGSLVYLVWQPPSNDFAVQDFRFRLFRAEPFAIWNNQWFAGHHTPPYSLVSPLLGSVLGTRLFGVLGVLLVAVLGATLVHRVVARVDGLRHERLAAALLAVGGLSSLYGGRLTFLFGVAMGLCALLAALGERWWLTALWAGVAAVTSPVAGVFVGVIGCAVWCSRSLPRRQGLSLAAGGVVPVLAIVVLFPEGGTFPFPIGGIINVLAVTASLAVLGWRYRFMRWMCLGYAAFCLVSALPQTPIGGNAARLAALAAPVVLVLVARFRLQWTGLLLVPLLVLQWAPVSLTFRGGLEQSEASFYSPLLDVLRGVDGPKRIEVVPVATHAEADHVALEVPIARGWDRQLDRKFNGLFYEDPNGGLDPQQYLEWLDEHGVTLVAIADTDLDVGGVLEQRLLEDPPDSLQLVWQDDVWRLYEVRPAPALVEGGATLVELGVDRFTLDVREAGDLHVKVRFSPWFRVTSGDACVLDDGDGWTVVRARGPGTVRVSADLRLGALFDRDGDC